MKRIAGAVAVVIVVAVLLAGWTYACEKDAHRMPACKKQSIAQLLEKEEWSDGEYALLTEQTGLGPLALDALREQGRLQELTTLQERYFETVEVDCVRSTPLTHEERVAAKEGMTIPCVEDGDILLTFCSHFFGWRNGHAGIVVDADEGLVLEAQVLGSPSAIVRLKRWERYPSFLVLRLAGASAEERKAVADYAREQLLHIPYRLSAGIWDRLGDSDVNKLPEGTQCAHLVWYAYMQHGYDLDSDGGLIVTPRDLADSELLTVVQQYGIH